MIESVCPLSLLPRCARRRLGCYAVLLTLLTTVDQPQAARDLVGARGMALGEAVRATVNGTAAPLTNPAGMSTARAYLFSGMYQFRGGDSASMVSVSLVDSITTRVAAGLYYQFLTESPERQLAQIGGSVRFQQDQTTHETGLALSIPLGSWLALGVTTKYLNHSVSLPEDSELQLTTASISTVSVDVGAVLTLFQSLRLAVVGYNLAPVETPLYAQSLGLGAAYSLGRLLNLSFDTVLDFNSSPDSIATTLHGGLESLLGNRYALRGGVHHDVYRDATYVSGGIGLLYPVLRLEAALRQQIDGGAATLFTIGVALDLEQWRRRRR